MTCCTPSTNSRNDVAGSPCREDPRCRLRCMRTEKFLRDGGGLSLVGGVVGVDMVLAPVPPLSAASPTASGNRRVDRFPAPRCATSCGADARASPEPVGKWPEMAEPSPTTTGSGRPTGDNYGAWLDRPLHAGLLTMDQQRLMPGGPSAQTRCAPPL